MHEKSASHVQAFLKWKDLEVRLSCQRTIDHGLQEAIEREAKTRRKILHRFVKIIKYLAKQNLPFRGHGESLHGEPTSNRGNFLEAVHMMAESDPVLEEHLARMNTEDKTTVTYLSPQTQNEFIEILGNHVRRSIVDSVKEAKYFTLMLNSTPDIPHRDQTSQVLRYVVINGKNVKVRESFIDFIETRGKRAEDVTNMILNKLQHDGVDIQNCRGQSYDNASVMSGQHSGVQKRIQEINPRAQFVACTNHSLNLAAHHAASVSMNSLIFFGTLDHLFNFFSSSTWQILKDSMGTVKRIIDERWCARGDAAHWIGEGKNPIPAT